MNIVVFGASGLLGRAIAGQLRSAGHHVSSAGRSGCAIKVDFRTDANVAALRHAVHGTDIVINATGILMEKDGNRFDVVHHQAVAALAQACTQERVARFIHISALGVGSGIPGAYMASKLAGEQALAQQRVDYAIVRPGLLVDAACPSTRLFQWLARLPVFALPGLLHPGGALVSPIQVSDVALCVARIAEHPKALRRVIELAGPPMRYRDMLLRLRHAQGRGLALWWPVPWWLMKLGARLAEYLPQRVFCVDTVRMLQAHTVPKTNEAARWLGRAPLGLIPGPGQPQDASYLGAAA